MTWEIAFSIGPVQGFVAQSRRTRDLWGSSYLLSYLAAKAARGGELAGASIIRPAATDDELYGWVSRQREQPPGLGTFPNQFILAADGEPEPIAEAVTAALGQAWTTVHEAVWRRFVEPVASTGVGTRAIWDRQVASCWEVVWAAAPADGEAHEDVGATLARRKTWRTHRLSDEPGDKCTVMPNFQELSGRVRSRGGRRGQEAFWNALRDRLRQGELRDGEHLSAPALVKRLFASCAGESIGGSLDVDRWPSTLHIAAVPWLMAVRDQPAAAEFAKAAQEAGASLRSRPPMAIFDGLEPAGLFRLDPNFYQRASLSSPKAAPLTDESARAELGRQLEQLGRVPVYYALLVADGDRLGTLVRNAGVGTVSGALARFTGAARHIVERHRGVTVYAGGDDVLAMLPVPDALGCADELARSYAGAFDDRPGATLSAAVVFSHIRAPIGDALGHAHELLDDVAKEANDRDSLVAAVLKPGGETCRWVTSWSRRYPDRAASRAVEQIDALAARVGARAGLSTSLLYHLRDTLALLAGLRRWEPGATGRLDSDLDLHAYLRAELLDSWETTAPDHDGDELSEFAGLVADLLAAAPGTPDGTIDRTRTGLDALMLARFLSTGGREEHD